MLPRLVKAGRLIAVRDGKRFVYAAPRRCRGKALFIKHGLGCTEGLVRIWRSRMNSEIVPESKFKGLGVIPEWGIRYPDRKTMILYEFLTEDYFNRSNKMKAKLNAYRKYLPVITERFAVEKSTVLFVIEAERGRVINYVKKYGNAEDRFFYTDYETFKSVQIPNQLTEKIYVWFGGIDSLMD